MPRFKLDFKRTVLLILLVGIGGIASLAIRDALREPSYAGKPLGYWVDQLQARIVFTNGSYAEPWPGVFATRAEAEAAQAGQVERAETAKKAVRALGSRSLPLLLARLATKRDSAIKSWVIHWGYKLHAIKRNSRFALSPQCVRGQAVTGLLELGSEARPAIPKLLILVGSSDPEVSASARHVLERLAPDELHRMSSPQR